MLFNCLVKDHNADAFKGLEFNLNKSSRFENLILNCLDGLNKWDSRYFITISNYGYQQPEWTAFFPLYPWLINQLGSILNPILNLDYPAIHMLTAQLINLVAFTVSSVVLYKLTICLFNDKLYAINTCKWFAYNPASIFFSASYTESLYSAFVFTAIWLLYQRYPKIQREQNFNLIQHSRSDNLLNNEFDDYKDCNDKYVKLFSHKLDSELISKLMNDKFKFVIAILLFTFASLTRSNGIINIGFFWYLLILDNFKLIFHRKISKLVNLVNLAKFLIFVLSTCIVISPFLLVQYSHKNNFCSFASSTLSTSIPHRSIFNSRNLISINPRKDELNSESSLHFDSKSTKLNERERTKISRLCEVKFWSFYSAVQLEYWNVGFLKYFRFRKIPNFLLATPMIMLVFFIFKYFIESSKSSSNLVKNGLGNEFWNRTSLLLPFVVHLLFLTFFALFNINVEVLTRLICSSSPLIYWSIPKLPRKIQNYIKIYFFLYFMIGIFAFSNFLPWT